MDSILGDSIIGGRRVRNATLEYALANYPRVIIGLKLGKMSVISEHSCSGSDIISVIDSRSPIYKYFMTRSDYNKCVLISKSISIPLFVSNKEKEFFDMASAHIKVHFT